MQCIMRRAAVVAAILFAIQTPAAAGWKVTNLGKSIQYSSLAVDADGHPHISYLAGSSPSTFMLRYVHFNGKTWRRQTVDTGGVGIYSAIAVDSQGHPHIAYSGLDSSSMLKYAAFDGTSWTITTVDTGGYSPDIVMDPNGHPHISYALSTIGGNVPLRYAHHDGSNWVIEAVSSTMLSFGGSSIALTGAGAAWISFCDQSSNLYVASNASGSWVVGFLDTGLHPSLALDNADRPRIFYASVAATKYAAWSGTMWSFTTLPDGAATSLALDGSGRPHVSFGAIVGNDLEWTYSMDPGSGFVGVALPGPGIFHRNTSIALDALGLPHITANTTNGTLRYAQLRLADIGGAFQNVSRTPLVSGDRLTARLEVFNLGNLNTRPVSVQFYLSDNGVFDAGDLPLGPPRNVGAIAPGKDKLVNFSHTFAGTVPGTHLFAVLDSAEKNVETSEVNNTVSGIIP